MNTSRKTVLLGLVFVSVLLGCNPRATIRPNPGPRDHGLRFYRPKPYLLVTPKSVVIETAKTSTTTTVRESTEHAGQFVEIKLEYLPDFSEEYSINVRPGLGTNNTKIKLEHGWNLTQLDQELDSQFDDNVKAIADLVKSTGSIVGTDNKGTDLRTGSSVPFVVAATNVPIGYYESVISRDSCGRKQLYGWKYVGFAPFQGCPLVGYGQDCIDCQSGLYGLVFRNGVMTFAALADAAYVDVRLTPQEDLDKQLKTENRLGDALAQRLASDVQAGRIPAFVAKSDDGQSWIIFSDVPLSADDQSVLVAAITQMRPAADLSTPSVEFYARTTQ